MIEFEALIKKTKELKPNVEKMLINFEIDDLITLEPEIKKILENLRSSSTRVR